jgi:MerR family transcriptional regulator, thiopeptide resistance regulator
MSYTVGQLAALAGVTVRTLHHYDRVGLLEPEERSGAASYRRYGSASVERLHRILSYRELGLSLDDIAALLDDPGVDRLAHLRRQEQLLRDRIGRLEEMVAAVRLMIEAEHLQLELTPEERFELFGDFDLERFADDAHERWGETDAYKEARRRTAGYGADDWRAINFGASEIEAGLAALMSAGEAADGNRAMELAERHRAHIDRWFYECSAEAHRLLGELYVSDARFAEHFEEVAPGLAEFVRDAIVANAQRLAGES